MNAETLALLADLFRICNDNAREYGHQYREQCDRLRDQLVRAGHRNVDEVYSIRKPLDEGITTAMSRWRWWRDEAIRVRHELEGETLLSDHGVETMPAWYLHTLRESVRSARQLNEQLHKARSAKVLAEHRAMTAPTIPVPTVGAQSGRTPHHAAR